MITNLLGEEKHHSDLSCFPRREASIDLVVFQQYQETTGKLWNLTKPIITVNGMMQQRQKLIQHIHIKYLKTMTRPCLINLRT